MSLSSTYYCCKRRDCINYKGQVTIVLCKQCAKENVLCQILLLSNKYRNYKAIGGRATCEPIKIPALDFLGINKALAELEEQEATTEAAIDVNKAIVQAAINQIAVQRSKQKRLHKQKKLLK